MQNSLNNDAAEFEFKFDMTGDTQWAPFSVLDTDGHTYLIAYSCQMSYGGLIQNEMFWTLSHRPLDSQDDTKDYEKITGQGQKVFEEMFEDFNYNTTMEEVIQGNNDRDYKLAAGKD